ncbi:hypothetical protein [Bradyrhizobium sp. CCBAU 45389]|uniref:hypothetical protein n=1 Tax=Bradyrhizobium sp. CCBAU 45389 TaxID=858429 RepID=UPI0023065E60|nr:hypothetical protein [Bradyrhizobium sp. CCBAU 45389]MDA9400779.1 hypothetical protein [Bradyrhizobium sp. CCBAU 45389]
MDYVPTVCLSNDEGVSLLRKLGELDWVVGMYTTSTGKLRRVRRGSPREATAYHAFSAAMIDALHSFDIPGEFSQWLIRNHCEHIEAWLYQEGLRAA